jgi:hypothetical protein
MNMKCGQVCRNTTKLGQVCSNNMKLGQVCRNNMKLGQVCRNNVETERTSWRMLRHTWPSFILLQHTWPSFMLLRHTWPSFMLLQHTWPSFMLIRHTWPSFMLLRHTWPSFMLLRHTWPSFMLLRWNLVKCVVTFFSWFFQSRRCLCHLQILKESLGHVQIWYNTLACRQHLSHILSFNRRMCLYKNLTLTDSVWKHVQCLAAVAWEAKKPLTIETIDGGKGLNLYR